MLNRTLVLWLLVSISCTAGFSGCTAEVHRYIRFPDFMHPGWANQQRRDAIQHDPYPLNDIGPEVVGGRPREYQQPVNEVERAQMFAPRPVAAAPMPSLPWPVAPPQAVTTPPIITTPYPGAPGQSLPFPAQQRSPY
jgi:hypothetical protein